MLPSYSESFAALLRDAMERAGVGGRRLEDLLHDAGIHNISDKRISEYCNALHTPSYEKARQLLDVLDYPLSDQELLESLRRNRELIREGSAMGGSYDPNRELHTTIRIKLRKLVPGQSAEENERYLHERVLELFGREKSLSDYIQWLIAKDLSESVISREDIIE